MTTRTLFTLLTIAAVCLACPRRAVAHRFDEYLQATLISVERDSVGLEIDLTVGANVAKQVFALIDRDLDGKVSAEEGRAYAELVLRSIAVSIDKRPVPVTLLDQRFPEFSEMAEGVGTIRLRASATFPATAAGEHRVYYRNTHEPEMGVYLVNALVPSNHQIEIAKQQRDYLQHELTIEYRVNAESRWASFLWIIAGLAMLTVLGGTRGIHRVRLRRAN